MEDGQRGLLEGVVFSDFLRQTGLEGIIDPDTGRIAEAKMPTTRLFLNRLLSLKLETQCGVFEAFEVRMQQKVQTSIQRGSFDTGLQTLRAVETRVLGDEVAYTDPRTGAQTRLVELELKNRTTRHDFPDRLLDPTWLVNATSGRVYARRSCGGVTLENGSIAESYRLWGTGGTQFKTAQDFRARTERGNGGDQVTVEPYRQIDAAQARQLWERENARRPEFIHSRVHMVVGAMLPIWDRLKGSGGAAIKVARALTSDGQRFLGMVVEPGNLVKLRERLNVSSGAALLPMSAVLDRLLAGEAAELANGWKLKRAHVSGQLRIELQTGGGLDTASQRELRAAGLLHERISWADRYFVPVGADATTVLARLTAHRPVAAVFGRSHASAADVAESEQEESLDEQAASALEPQPGTDVAVEEEQEELAAAPRG